MASAHMAKGTALITGASSGIGAIYADRLARRGYDLILVARDAQRLQAVATQLVEATGRSAQIVTADLTLKADQLHVERLLHGDDRITLLINNAGVGATRSMIDSDVESLDRMIQLNVTALTRMAHAAALAFVARHRGAIVNIGSVVALAPEVLNGTYAATKAFVLTLSQSLHHELSPMGIQVQAVLPGATHTDFWTVAGVPVAQLPETIVMSAKDMVDAALVGFDRRELVTIPSLPEVAQWDLFESARKAMGANLSLSVPAARYRA